MFGAASSSKNTHILWCIELHLPFLRFNLLCNIEGDHTDAILTVTLQDHRLEAPQPQCGEGQDQCTDSVKLTLFGRICTTCGTGPLRCREQPDFPLLPSLIPISGGSRFLLQFKTNRDNETRGFQFLSQCVEKSYFSTTDCSIPDPPVQKRMMTKDTTMVRITDDPHNGHAAASVDSLHKAYSYIIN